MNYLYNNDWRHASTRLAGLERIEDEHTFRLLDRLGIPAGGRCLEVGAGAGSVAAWLCNRVGTGGCVTATDIDTRLLPGMKLPQMEIRRHDIVRDGLEKDAFDVVHVRHVLVHVPREELLSVVSKLVASLAEGGLMLAEESSFLSARAEPSADSERDEIYETVLGRIHELYSHRGMVLDLGFQLFHLLRSAGLDCEGAEGRLRIVRGGSLEAAFHKHTFTQLRPAVLESCSALADKYDVFLSLHDDRRFTYRTRTTVATWGRKAAY
jgi:protein-L-isoaspartate O-methyltransferase